jgi:GNAT superfamily N-acetyltransferase
MAILALAECLNASMPLAAGDERIERPSWVVWLGSDANHPAFTVVQRFRLHEDEVASAVAEIRALLASRGRARSSWEIGPSSTPHDLEARLLALGLRPYEEPEATGMILRRPLASSSTDIVARRAETVDEYVAGFELLSSIFGERDENDAERRARATERLAAHRAGSGAFYVAVIDGEIVGAASAMYTEHAVVLSGSATLPHARGRGVYRALIAARYDGACARNTPTLVIQAGAMSRPILERLGFEPVAALRILEDRTA